MSVTYLHVQLRCGLTVQQSGGDGVVEAVAAVAAVAAGDLIVVGALQGGEVRARTLVQLPLQDPTHGAAPPTGHFRCWYVENVTQCQKCVTCSRWDFKPI